MGKPFNPQKLLPIETEILREKAAALGRVGHRLEQVIEQLHRIEAEARRLHGAARHKRVLEHAALRREAEQLRWKMTVQREAMGLRRHDDVDRVYPIRPALR